MKIFGPLWRKSLLKIPDLFNKMLFPLYAMNESTNESYEILSFIVKKTIIIRVNI